MLPSLLFSGEKLILVVRFTYFGSFLVKNDSAVVGISISKTGAEYAGLRHLWHWPDISLKMKSRVYCASVCSVLLYGCMLKMSLLGFWTSMFTTCC